MGGRCSQLGNFHVVTFQDLQEFVSEGRYVLLDFVDVILRDAVGICHALTLHDIPFHEVTYDSLYIQCQKQLKTIEVTSNATAALFDTLKNNNFIQPLIAVRVPGGQAPSPMSHELNMTPRAAGIQI